MKAKSKATDDSFGTVLAALEPLRVNPDSRLEVRVLAMKRGGVRRLDVRQFVENDKFTGFTRRGLSLSLEEFGALVEQRARILELLNVQPAVGPVRDSA